MDLKLLVLVFATIFISSEIQSVQGQPFSFLPFRYSKWGIGPCPKVRAMKGFDITKVYGGSWYMVAHYLDFNLLDRHCTELRYGDANPGKDICRVLVNRTSIEYDDEEIKATQYFLLLPNETDHSTWIDTYHNVPSKTYILDTDYNNYLLLHECNQFPRDNPFLYEQHNYIVSRTGVWPGGLKNFKNALKIYESFRIDTGPFIWHDQDNCKEVPDKPIVIQ